MGSEVKKKKKKNEQACKQANNKLNISLIAPQQFSFFLTLHKIKLDLCVLKNKTS
jgi:hypothetical protein